MEEQITAKIVTISQPFLVQEGNSWISLCVYEKDGKYYQRPAVPPSIKHGPWEVGEECEIEPSNKDKEAESWMIEIYNNPKNYKRILEEEKILKIPEEDRELSGIEIIFNILICIAVIAVIGVLLITFIKGA